MAVEIYGIRLRVPFRKYILQKEAQNIYQKNHRSMHQNSLSNLFENRYVQK